MQTLLFLEREKIEFFIRGKWSVRRIGRELNRDHTVIAREIARNTVKGKKYSAKTAQELADRRARKTNVSKLEKDDDLKRHVVGLLREDWSPEYIAGRLKAMPPPSLGGRTVCHETIYRYIYSGYGRWQDLYRHLRRGRRKRMKRHTRRARNAGIPFKTSIHLRSPEIGERKVPGHWESDTMVFRRQATCLSVQYERTFSLTRINKIKNKSAEATENALVKSMESLPADMRKSITFDNGGEAARHTNLRLCYGIDTFFCDAYASWQKGGVENTNGLIRYYLPRDTNMSEITDGDVLAIENRLNNRPRKRLGYLTPNEAYARYLAGVVH